MHGAIKRDGHNKTNHLVEISEDNKLVKKIRELLPYFFQLAELESSRAGKIWMDVGALRERIVIALLIYKIDVEMFKYVRVIAG